MSGTRENNRRTFPRASFFGHALSTLVVLGIGVALVRVVIAEPPQTTKPGKFMVQARVGDRLLEGQALAWSDDRVYLLSRDGQLVDFAPEDARDYRESPGPFTSYPVSKIRAQLLREFGSNFDVTGTGHYLVVHPRGQRDKWAHRFEELYRSFYHYFQVRGFDLIEPEFPLIAVVFSSKEDYRRYARAGGAYLGSEVLGHYSPRTNRISLFDVTGGDNSHDWSQNAATIIHEVTHQVAFNCGVHTRFNDVPRWVSEGLATMFEARGVWNSLNYRTPNDRINLERLSDFEKYVEEHRKRGSLIDMIASDRLFKAHPQGAYAQAWALSYYLCQTQPRHYCEYLALTADRASFQEYSAEDRVADFRAVFGDDLEMVEAQFLRHMARIP